MESATPRMPPAASMEHKKEDGDTWVCCDKCESWHLLPEGLPAPGDNEEWFCTRLGPGYDCGIKPPGAKPTKERTTEPPRKRATKEEPPASTGDGETPAPKRPKKEKTPVQRGMGGAPARAKYGEVISVGLGLIFLFVEFCTKSVHVRNGFTSISVCSYFSRAVSGQADDEALIEFVKARAGLKVSSPHARGKPPLVSEEAVRTRSCFAPPLCLTMGGLPVTAEGDHGGEKRDAADGGAQGDDPGLWAIEKSSRGRS